MVMGLCLLAIVIAITVGGGMGVCLRGIGTVDGYTNVYYSGRICRECFVICYQGAFLRLIITVLEYSKNLSAQHWLT